MLAGWAGPGRIGLSRAAQGGGEREGSETPPPGARGDRTDLGTGRWQCSEGPRAYGPRVSWWPALEPPGTRVGFQALFPVTALFPSRPAETPCDRASQGFRATCSPGTRGGLT